MGEPNHGIMMAYELLTEAADMNFPIAAEDEYLFVDA